MICILYRTLRQCINNVLILLLGPFCGAIAVPSVMRCRCCRCGHRFYIAVDCRHHYQDEPKPAIAIVQAACGPNIFQMLLVIIIIIIISFTCVCVFDWQTGRTAEHKLLVAGSRHVTIHSSSSSSTSTGRFMLLTAYLLIYYCFETVYATTHSIYFTLLTTYVSDLIAMW